MNTDTHGKGSSPPPLINIVLTADRLQKIAFLLDAITLILAYQLAVPIAAFVIETFQTSPLESYYGSVDKHLITCFILSLGILLSFFVGGHYTKRIPWWSQIQLILKVILFTLLIEGFTAYVLNLYYSRILILTHWSLAFTFLLLSRFVLNQVKVSIASWKLPTVIVGDIDTITDTLFAIDSDRGMGFNPQLVLLRDKNVDAFDREELPEKYRKIECINAVSGCLDFVEKNPQYYYVISMEAFRGDKRESLLNLLNKKKIEFALLPTITQTSLYHSKPLYFFGNDVMMLETRDNSLCRLDKVMKRAMDVTGALIGLALLTIPMVLVAIMLKIEGQGGSILYSGNRLGEGGRHFRCWKFRTMEPGTDHLLHKYLEENPEAKAYWDRYFKISNDPRVQTRTAKFIRKASVDELPQLWNILKGEMSLVGPRPILPNEIDSYGDNFSDYTSVKPGLTGLWQVSGRSGTSFRRRVIWDRWYIRNWSLWGDIVIILKTIFVVLNRSGAS